MSRVKVLMLSLLAVFAVAAIASSSASALVWEACLKEHLTGTLYKDSHCKEESATGTWSWMPIEESFAVTSKGEKQELALPTAGITIICTSVEDAGTIEPSGKDKTSKILYKGCTITGVGTCPIVKSKGKPNEEIEVTSLVTELQTQTVGTKLLVVDLFQPEKGEIFVELEIGKKEEGGEAKGACGVLSTKDPVKGTVKGMVEGQRLVFTGEGTLTTFGLVSEYKGLDDQVLTNGNLFRAST
jgi:hypothetical protein